MLRAASLAASVAVLLACGDSGTSPTDDTNTPPVVRNVPGSYSRTLTIAGQTREYIAYVGSSVGTTAAAPVVFMFHGSGQSGPQFYNISRWVEKADQYGLIAVFPSALTYCYKTDRNRDGDMTDAGELQVESKWTSGEVNTPEAPLCSAAELAALPTAQRTLANHAFQDDLPFIDDIITSLKTSFVVDAKRIYGTGFSNGAQFSTRLAAERSQVFAALAGHGGSLAVPSTPPRLMSYAQSLGSVDEHVQAAFGIAELPLTQDMFALYPGMKALYVTPMLALLRLADVSTYDELTANGKKVSRWTWRTSTGGGANSFTFSLIDDNDHAYPNGSLHPVVIAEPLWQFFTTQRLP